MKTIFAALFLLLPLCSVAAQPSAPDTLRTIDTLDWLIGTWNRTNAKPGRSGVEMWKKISDTELHGRGISMKGGDTTFVEKLKIVVKENEIYYVADVPENDKLVYFKFTQLTDHGFTCENVEHDFPKMIRYESTGSKLTATISGNGKRIEYLFEKE